MRSAIGSFRGTPTHTLSPRPAVSPAPRGKGSGETRSAYHDVLDFEDEHQAAPQSTAQQLAIAVGQAPRAAWTTNGALQIVFSEGFGSGSIIRHVTVTGRGASATISAVTDLSSPIAGAYTPRIAARGDDLHVVWEDKALGEAEVFYSAFKGGAWTAPASISRSPAHSNRPSVTIDRGGLVHVAWHEQDGADQRVAHVTRR